MAFKTDYSLMQVKSIAPREHSARLSTCIELPFVFKTFVLSIFGLFKTGFTVYKSLDKGGWDLLDFCQTKYLLLFFCQKPAEGTHVGYFKNFRIISSAVTQM